ncbi:MAG TPA: hypothetical protein VIF82_02165 [Burkholderiaceae bacterium]|jgi:hypothetical protein
MSRLFIFVFIALGLSIPCIAQTTSSTCRANVECKGLFNELVTDKFLERFPPDKWEIFVYADTYAFGDGKATSQAVVGVVPVSTGKFVYFPNQTSSHIVTTPRLSNGYDKQDVERKTIRRAVEKLMASCNALKNCDLD